MEINTSDWKGIKWIYTYVVFSILIALILANNSPEVQAGSPGIINAFIFFFAAWCAKNDFDTKKTILQKTAWVIGLWIGQTIFMVLFLFVIAKTGLAPREIAPTLAHLLAGFIILYLAMSRSTTFVSHRF